MPTSSAALQRTVGAQPCARQHVHGAFMYRISLSRRASFSKWHYVGEGWFSYQAASPVMSSMSLRE